MLQAAHGASPKPTASSLSRLQNAHQRLRRAESPAGYSSAGC
ncbi:hypothetical protein [Klebsiella pneumoniae IS53]|nr:hypothetical protein [Klebsiella pneumoniae IS53]